MRRSEQVRLASCLFVFLLAPFSVFLFPPSQQSSSVFYVSAAFFIIALGAASYKKGAKEGLASLGLSPRRKEILPLVGLGTAAALTCMAATFVISSLFYLTGSLDTSPVLEKVGSLPALALIAAFTIAPLGEEAFFRGLLFRRLDCAFTRFASFGKGAAWLAAALLSSFLFSLMHLSYGSVAELAVAFFMGFILCAYTKKSGSLVPALVAHSLFNLASIISMVLL
jgi:membrane protease YdiL (CAAX protease family)